MRPMRPVRPMRPPRPLAVLAALIALVPAAWFALGAVQSESQDHAEATLATATRLGARQARRVAALLDTAGTLNPDRQIAIDRVELLLDSGRPRAARRLAETITGQEPENLEAWVWLAHSAGGDGRLYLYALRHARRLEPRLP